jgi:hypothetical protein
MTTISGPLADALKRGRESFNARFAVARKAGKVDGDALLAHLAENVDPIVRAVHGEFAEKVDSVTLELYDLSLALFASSLLGPGAKSPAVADAWRTLLPRAAKLLAREPSRVAGSVTNAVHNLAANAATQGTQPAMWTSAMIELAPWCGAVQALLDCGKVLAWRCGMVQYRAGALAAARQLDASLASKALGVRSALNAAALDRLAADPWLLPQDAAGAASNPRRLSVRKTAGDFRGFSGAFIRPPVVANVEGELLVSDGEFTWSLLTDVFGTHMQRVDRPGPPPGRAAKGVTFDGSGIITWDNASARIDDLANISSLACDGATLAVTIPTSHHVFLLARG